MPVVTRSTTASPPLDWAPGVKATLTWMFGLTLLLLTAAGLGAYWAYARSDELLQAEIHRQLKLSLPGAGIQLQRANFDWRGRVRVFGLALTPPGTDRVALTIPELTISLDREALADSQLLVVQKISATRPHLNLIRQSDGRWNLALFEWNLTGGGPIPDLLIDRGTITVEGPRTHAPGQDASVSTLSREIPPLEDLTLAMAPTSARRLAIEFKARFEPAGPLSARGSFDLDQSLQTLEFRADRFPIDSRLLQWGLLVFPEWQREVLVARERLDGAIAALRASSASPGGPNGSDLSGGQGPTDSSRPADGSGPASNPARSQGAANPLDLGIALVCDLKLVVQPPHPEAPQPFQLQAKIVGGQVDHEALPWPLSHLQGELYLDRSQFVFRNVSARHGATHLHVSGRHVPTEGTQFEGTFANVPINDEVTRLMPDRLQRLVELVGVTGIIGGKFGLNRVNGQPWVPSVEAVITEATLNHQKFRYPVRQARCEFNLQDNFLAIKGSGRAGTLPVELTGWVRNPGPACESHLFLTANEIPLDATFRAACPPAVRRTMELMHLQGTADIQAQFYRPPELDGRYVPNITARVHNAEMEYEYFPYRVSALGGLLKWVGDEVTFEELRGVHDGATLEGRGRYLLAPAPGHLQMSVTAVDAAFDRTLELALTPDLQETWRQINPSGQLDLRTEISWTPGQPPTIDIPNIRMRRGGLLLDAFRYAMQDVEATGSYTDRKFEFQSLIARHDDTQLRSRGRIDLLDDEYWRLKFDEFYVDDLLPSPAFRRALPPTLRQIMDGLNPEGRLSVSGPWTISGRAADSSTLQTEWDHQIVLAGGSIVAGQNLEKIHGRVRMAGQSGPGGTDMTGQLDVNSLNVLGHQLTQIRGPIRYNGTEFVVGDRRVIIRDEAMTPQELTSADHVTGRAVDGVVTLDAVFDFSRGIHYSAQATLSRGNLEKYAQRYLRGQNNLRGEMNGWVNWRGSGVSTQTLQGEGRMLISPAALYELPVVIQMFNAMSLDPGRRVAFNSADLVFTIGENRFNFNRILLDGSAISMFGRGNVGFDGAMNLDFYSEMGRNRVGVPILKELLAMASRGWVGVEVRGNVGNPVARAKPVPELDDTLKQFLGQFRQPLPPPPTYAPAQSQVPSDSPPR